MPIRLHALLTMTLSCVVLVGCATAPPPSPPVPTAEQVGLQRRPIPPSGIHVVAPGETLSEIAYVYRLDLQELARANRIEDIDRLAVGRRLALRWPEPIESGGQPVRAARSTTSESVDAPAAEPLRVVVPAPSADEEPAEATPPTSLWNAQNARAEAPMQPAAGK